MSSEFNDIVKQGYIRLKRKTVGVIIKLIENYFLYIALYKYLTLKFFVYGIEGEIYIFLVYS